MQKETPTEKLTTTPTTSLSSQDKQKIVSDLCGCIPADITLEEAREERLSQI